MFYINSPKSKIWQSIDSIFFCYLPRLKSQPESLYFQTEMNAPGGFVRSKLHGLEKNERKIVWTYASLDICNSGR